MYEYLKDSYCKYVDLTCHYNFFFFMLLFEVCMLCKQVNKGDLTAISPKLRHRNCSKLSYMTIVS